MSIRELRETINLFIYDSKMKALGVLSAMNFVVSFTSIALMIYYYGYHLSAEEKHTTFVWIQFSFGFYIVHFLLKIIYEFDVKSFLKKNWIEAFIIAWLLIEGIAFNFFDTLFFEPLFNRFGFVEFKDFSIIFVQLFVFIILINSIMKKRNFKPWMKIHPGWLFTISILTMTFIGAVLLMLPEMSKIDGGMKFIDAVFTAMSSVSVTGLTTIDISQALTFKGQMVLLVLIKLGGLNTIAFGALMLIVAKFGVGIKYHEVIEDFMNRNSILKANTMLAKIVVWATTIEVIGIILMFIGFGDKGVFANTGDRLFYSVFHSVSGFNNAGMSVLPNGMMHPDLIHNTFVQSVATVLIFLGGFGMVYMFDLISIKRLRERMIMPWKTIMFGTKISLYFTLGLLLFGAIIFYIFEYNNTLRHDSFLSDVVTSFFQSMTTRSAGFSVVETSELSLPVFITFLFLMFVGASSGSAGGGIRTSTFAVMCASLVSTVRGKKHTELFKRTIANDTVLKAYAIFMFFVIGNIIGPFVLAITEADLLASGKFHFMDLVFEHVSAAGTVGLSTGLTAELSVGGKIVIIIAMFIGRVGTLTLAYLVGKKVISTNYKYPLGHSMVG